MSSKTNNAGLTVSDISKLKALRHHDVIEINGEEWGKWCDEEEFHVYPADPSKPGRIVKFFRAFDEPHV